MQDASSIQYLIYIMIAMNLEGDIAEMTELESILKNAMVTV